MGRKLRGAALRAKKRADESVLEIVQGQADEVQGASDAAKTDDELFVVDTTAVLPSQKQLAKKAFKKQQRQKQTSSAKEQAQIDKLIQNHTPAQLQLLAQQAAGKRVPRIKAPVAPSTFDLWNDDNDKKKTKKEDVPTTTTTMAKTPAGIKPASHVQIRPRAALPDPSKTNHSKKQQQLHPPKVTVDVAKSGQSYNPDHVEHQKVLREALLVETKRLAAEKEAKAKVSQGLRPETKALLLGDDDDDDTDSENDEKDGVNDDDGMSDNIQLAKRPEKLTRAQRNKQKRLRQEAHEIHARKRQKKLQNTVEEAKGIARKLRKQEEASKAQKEALEALKVATRRTPGRDVYQHLATEHPLTAPTFPVALPASVGASGKGSSSSSSLRTLRPKGSLVTDRMISLTDRDMAVKRAVKQKRRVEGKRRKVRVRGKGYEVTKQGEILG